MIRTIHTRLAIFLLLFAAQGLWCPPIQAQQQACKGKLSPMLRRLVRGQQTAMPGVRSTTPKKEREVCALMKVSCQPDEVLAQYGCRELARVGDISITSIPIGQIVSLSRDDRVVRIEAEPRGRTLCDSMACHLNAQHAYAGTELPQAFTGKGVVMGIMDIGFDLTHPTFYDTTLSDYRIRRFWDMLAADTTGSQLYVGRDYTTRDEMLALGHSRDGRRFWHGTGTLSIAAGSGYRSAYRGMAPESDICIVANAVGDDLEFIDPADFEKYTYATDALGFKYIFDYADSVGKPCVISFSEGSSQDFMGYDLLYYELIDKLVGPGHIIVSAAGNRGGEKFWFEKPAGQPSAGTFLTGYNVVDGTLKADAPFGIRLVAYGEHNDTLAIDTRQVVSLPDSLWADTLTLQGIDVAVSIDAYTSCYAEGETCYDVAMERLGGGMLGTDDSFHVSLEMVGHEANAEFWRYSATLTENDLNPQLSSGEPTHSIMSPASSPSVICVGGTYYRKGIDNYKGLWMEHEKGDRARRMTMSSMGPTMDGRTKPDVMAPGANIIQACSSYFLESNPGSWDDEWSVEHFDFEGRTYAWTATSGTSSASPAVGGAIALWLQANPRLTPDDVMGVIERTSSHPDPSLSYPNNEYGYGQIDVYRGLLDVLGAVGIDDISSTPTTIQISTAKGQLRLGCPQPAGHPLRLRLYSLSGKKMGEWHLPAGQQSYSVSVASRGIGIVQIDGDPHYQGSQIVRFER